MLVERIGEFRRISTTVDLRVIIGSHIDCNRA